MAKNHLFFFVCLHFLPSSAMGVLLCAFCELPKLLESGGGEGGKACSLVLLYLSALDFVEIIPPVQPHHSPIR